MTAQSNEAIARRFFDEFATGRKLDIADALFTSDYLYHDPQVPLPPAGPAGMVEVIKVYQNSVNGHWQVEDIAAAGPDKVVVRWTGSGKFVKEMPGVPLAPNGNAVKVDAISVMRIADGKIAEQWCVWDTLTFMKQIGAIPA